MDSSIWSRRVGALTLGMGVLALLGWAFAVDWLRSVLPGLVAMNPATAVVFMIAGCALVTRNRLVALAASGIAVGVGLSRLANDAGLAVFRIDGILFHDVLSGSRIAPNTAANFVLAGLAMWLLNSRRPFARLGGEMLAFLTALIGLLAIFGYAYGAPNFYGIGGWIPMALNTAIAFVALSIGIMLAHSGVLVSVLTGEGMGTRLARRLIPTVVVVGWLLGRLRLAGQRRGLYSMELGVAIMATVGIGFTVAFVIGSARSLNRMHARLVQIQRDLERLATLDPLTELANRRLFIERVGSEVSRAQRYGSLLSLAVLDCDHFKAINDNHGHAAGDEVLVRLGAVLRRELRHCDMAARIGGEELCALMPETSLGDARLVSERLRAAIAAEKFLAADGSPYHVTCSIGVAQLGKTSDDAQSFLARADSAMYTAKAAGRNRVAAEPPAIVVDARASFARPG